MVDCLPGLLRTIKALANALNAAHHPDPCYLLALFQALTRSWALRRIES